MTIQTIEKTGKKYKAMRAASWLVILLIVPILFLADHPILAVMVLVTSVLVGAVAEVGAWWDHG